MLEACFTGVIDMENAGGELANDAGSLAFLRGSAALYTGYDETRHQNFLRGPLAEPEMAKPPVASPHYGFIPGIPLRAEGGK